VPGYFPLIFPYRQITKLFSLSPEAQTIC
jgi:hypothetical protein